MIVMISEKMERL